ncbi:type II toxin-antitoxin system HicB family antitoxin [Phenylobacterium aquaticum]|uniref:type II toxin-antitoxin system HicB family antitoxin n=1 Tax=Phenylobacterium aquaticum TaxID=1763816 RepID=UPI0026EC3B19|nr:type II toxin-antitoxin system HicB family antitoxin [Phenylobacterium aquaticum]
MAHYRIELTPDDNDTFLVTTPDLPEVTTFAGTVEEASAVASAAIEEALSARISRGERIPPWSDKKGKQPVAALSSQTLLKLGLYNCLRLRGLTRAELARRLDWHREQVDRLFRLDHASKLDQLDAAFHALGEEIRFELFSDVA